MMEVNIYKGTMNKESCIYTHISIDRNMYLDLICMCDDYEPKYRIRYSKDPNYSKTLYTEYKGVMYPINLRKWMENEFNFITENQAREKVQELLNEGDLEFIALCIGGYIDIKRRETVNISEVCAEFVKYKDFLDLVIHCYSAVDMMSQKVTNLLYNRYKKLKLKGIKTIKVKR